MLIYFNSFTKGNFVIFSYKKYFKKIILILISKVKKVGAVSKTTKKIRCVSEIYTNTYHYAN